MSGVGAPVIEVDGQGMTVALLSASWHTEVMHGLRDGAQRAAAQAGASVEDFEVPGSFELSVAAAECAATGRFDAIVALGVIIRGGTPHFDYVCASVTQGLTQVSVAQRIPIGFGVLTCDDLEQALDRAGLADSREDKGAEAMMSALRTARVLADIRT